MIQHPRCAARRRAAAAAEFAVVLAILMPLLVGVWEVGRLVNASKVVMNSAREAGRQAATGIQTTAQVQRIVLNYLKNNGFSKINAVAKDSTDLSGGGKVLVTLTIYDSNGNVINNADPKVDAKQLNRIDVTVTLLYKDIEYSPTSFFLQPNFNVSETVSWNSMKDIPLAIDNVIPLY